MTTPLIAEMEKVAINRFMRYLGETRPSSEVLEDYFHKGVQGSDILASRQAAGPVSQDQLKHNIRWTKEGVNPHDVDHVDRRVMLRSPYTYALGGEMGVAARLKRMQAEGGYRPNDIGSKSIDDVIREEAAHRAKFRWDKIWRDRNKYSGTFNVDMLDDADGAHSVVYHSGGQERRPSVFLAIPKHKTIEKFNEDGIRGHLIRRDLFAQSGIGASQDAIIGHHELDETQTALRKLKDKKGRYVTIPDKSSSVFSHMDPSILTRESHRAFQNPYSHISTPYTSLNLERYRNISGEAGVVRELQGPGGKGYARQETPSRVNRRATTMSLQDSLALSARHDPVEAARRADLAAPATGLRDKLRKMIGRKIIDQTPHGRRKFYQNYLDKGPEVMSAKERQDRKFNHGVYTDWADLP